MIISYLVLFKNFTYKVLFKTIFIFQTFSVMPVGKWGIISCGKISHDFCLAINESRVDHLDKTITHKLVACATRNNYETAEKFRKLHSIQKAYGSYSELLADDEIEIVYIGAINTVHFDIIKASLNAGKHVLCEKPFVLKASEAEEIFALAKSKNLFCMEAMWSRFHPGYKLLKSKLNTETYGNVISAQASFALGCGYLEETAPGYNRLTSESLGGGAIYDLGVYPLQFGLLGFGDENPKRITYQGTQIDNVDWVSNVNLFYETGLANCFSSIQEKGDHTDFDKNYAMFITTKGSFEVGPIFHCPTEITWKANNGDTENWSFPHLTPEKTVQYNFVNSGFLVYEASAVVEAISRGITECEEWTPEHTLRSLRIINKSLNRQ